MSSRGGVIFDVDGTLLLRSFTELNNLVLAEFSPGERRRIGVHTCAGGDQDSTHSADVDYAALLPGLFSLNAGAFYIQLASEPDRPEVLRVIAEHAKPGQRIFVGVTDPIDSRIETAEEVRDRVLEAAEYISPGRLGTAGTAGWLTWVQVGLNFVVPFLVSSYGYLTGARVPGGGPRRQVAQPPPRGILPSCDVRPPP